jgi:leucyl aminopeptidase
MPLHAGYWSQVESDVADMKNVGKVGVGGAIVAALILEKFTDGRPWAHLDIAGPARSESARGYASKGATAFGARTIVEFLEAVADEALTHDDEVEED